MTTHLDCYRGYEIEAIETLSGWRITLWPTRSDTPPMTGRSRAFTAAALALGVKEARANIDRHLRSHGRPVEMSLARPMTATGRSRH